MAMPTVLWESRFIWRVFNRRALSLTALQGGKRTSNAALQVILPAARTECSTYKLSRQEIRQLLGGFSFDSNSFDKQLTALLASVNDGVVKAADLAAEERRRLRAGSERWTRSRCAAASAAADLRSAFVGDRRLLVRASADAATFRRILRVHAALCLPLSAKLGAYARGWLAAKCRSLAPADLFAFFGHLPALFAADQRSDNPAEHRRGRLSIAATERDMQLLGEIACQAYSFFGEISLADLIRFLTDFAKMGVNPAQFDKRLLEDLFARLSRHYDLLTAAQGLEIITCVDVLNLEPGEALVESIASDLKPMDFGDMVATAAAICAQRRRALRYLTNDAGFWAALFRKAARELKSCDDWQLVSRLLLVLSWARYLPYANAVQSLFNTVTRGWQCSDEFDQLMRQFCTQQPSIDSEYTCDGLMRRALYAMASPDAQQTVNAPTPANICSRSGGLIGLLPARTSDAVQELRAEN